MNARQKVVLWVALPIGVVMGLVPPWKHVTNFSVSGRGADRSERPAGYAFLATPPDSLPNPITRAGGPDAPFGMGVQLDFGRLGLQSGLLLLLTGGLIYATAHAPGSRPIPVPAPAVRRSHDGARPAASSNAHAHNAHAHDASPSAWRYRSLGGTGYEAPLTLWVVAITAALFITFTGEEGQVLLAGNASLDRAGGTFVRAFIGCLVGGLIGSYLAWRAVGKSPTAAAIGAIGGAMLVMVACQYSEWEAQRQKPFRQPGGATSLYGDARPNVPPERRGGSVRAVHVLGTGIPDSNSATAHRHDDRPARMASGKTLDQIIREELMRPILSAPLREEDP